MICKLLHCLFLNSCYTPLYTLDKFLHLPRQTATEQLPFLKFDLDLWKETDKTKTNMSIIFNTRTMTSMWVYVIICTQGIHIYFIITLLLLSLPNHYVDYITNSFSRLNILRGLFIVLSWHVFMCVCCVCVIYLFDWQPNQLQNLLSVISVCRLVIFEAWMRWITYTPCQLKELNG